MEIAQYNAKVLQSELESDKDAVGIKRFRQNSVRPEAPNDDSYYQEVGRPLTKNSNLFDESTKLQRSFDLITDAYIQFDKKGTGKIKKYI